MAIWQDPEYDFYVRTADDYQRSLHEKYPLCDDCQAKVDGIVAEQKAILQQRRFNEKLTRSMTTKAPRKPSFYEYISRGSLWVLLHVVFLFICAAGKVGSCNGYAYKNGLIFFF